MIRKAVTMFLYKESENDAIDIKAGRLKVFKIQMKDWITQRNYSPIFTVSMSPICKQHTEIAVFTKAVLWGHIITEERD